MPRDAALLGTFSEWSDASIEWRQRAVPACVDRIARVDTSIHAWVRVHPQPPTGDGALSHIPFGVKDIIDTKGLPTEYGSDIYAGRMPAEDAALVRELRRLGGVVLGKTQTTPFAYRTPASTRNPRNLAHTPGGSSSGSAAAVAAGMVPFALGTQTKGSVLRPASYCGVTGFKPTYGLLSMDGVLPFAKSLDTLGFFTNTAADMLSLWRALGYPSGSDEDFAFGAPDPVPDVEPLMVQAFRHTLWRLRQAGASIRTWDLADILARLDEVNTVVMYYEGARVHEQRFQQHGQELEDLADLVREGLEIPDDRYDDARRFIDACRREIGEMFRATPVMLVPAATGPAPAGLASTGDPRMNSPWTALGTPAISIPMPVRHTLPLGLQLTAAAGDDDRVLRAAVHLEQLLTAGG